MKNLFFLLLCLPALAQSPFYVERMETFQQFYNEDDTEGVFDMMEDSMQEHLGLENLTDILSTFQEHLGDLLSFDFVSKEGFTETFEVTFEHSSLNMELMLHPNGKITGLKFLPATEEVTAVKLYSNTTPLSLPFKGEWFTVWGGDTKAQNYHVVSKTQAYAFDFLIMDAQGNTFRRSGTRNEDYFAFGKPIYAVCDAEVHEVITGVDDNRPGIMNPKQALGNYVVLKTENEEYMVYAHLEKETIIVKAGDVVKRGQYLGNCGNSGNSSEPHLHFHIQDGPSVSNALGVKCYFESLWLNGVLEKDYSPVKGDRITRPKE